MEPRSEKPSFPPPSSQTQRRTVAGVSENNDSVSAELQDEDFTADLLSWNTFQQDEGSFFSFSYERLTLQLVNQWLPCVSLDIKSVWPDDPSTHRFWKKVQMFLWFKVKWRLDFIYKHVVLFVPLAYPRVHFQTHFCLLVRQLSCSHEFTNSWRKFLNVAIKILKWWKYEVPSFLNSAHPLMTS